MDFCNDNNRTYAPKNGHHFYFHNEEVMVSIIAKCFVSLYSKKSAGENSLATIAVLNGEIAVPCNLQTATAGLTTSMRDS